MSSIPVLTDKEIENVRKVETVFTFVSTATGPRQMFKMASSKVVGTKCLMCEHSFKSGEYVVLDPLAPVEWMKSYKCIIMHWKCATHENPSRVLEHIQKLAKYQANSAVTKKKAPKHKARNRKKVTQRKRNS